MTYNPQTSVVLPYSTIRTDHLEVGFYEIVCAHKVRGRSESEATLPFHVVRFSDQVSVLDEKLAANRGNAIVQKFLHNPTLATLFAVEKEARLQITSRALRNACDRLSPYGKKVLKKKITDFDQRDYGILLRTPHVAEKVMHELVLLRAFMEKTKNCSKVQPYSNLVLTKKEEALLSQVRESLDKKAFRKGVEALLKNER